MFFSITKSDICFLPHIWLKVVVILLVSLFENHRYKIYFKRNTLPPLSHCLPLLKLFSRPPQVYRSLTSNILEGRYHLWYWNSCKKEQQWIQYSVLWYHRSYRINNLISSDEFTFPKPHVLKHKDLFMFIFSSEPCAITVTAVLTRCLKLVTSSTLAQGGFLRLNSRLFRIEPSSA